MGVRRWMSFIGLGVTWSCASVSVPPTGQTIPVAVDVRCTGPNVAFSVSPWHLELTEGDEVVWNLADATQSIEIRKRQSAWPFNDNKFTGNQGAPPTGKAMKSGQKGKSFRYSIAVGCEGSEGARRVELDPDVYIKR